MDPAADRSPWCIPDGELLYLPSFLAPSQADQYLRALLDSVTWEQHAITLYGRRHLAPRLSAWYGDPGARYSYSGLALEPWPWIPELAGIKAQIEEAAGCSFNSALLNQYRNGSDSMGWHSDDEPELGQNPTIASLSLGEARRFLLRHKRRRDLETVELSLGHGALLIMRGPTQHHWKHQVPRTRQQVGVRLNLTFRTVFA